MKFEHPRNVPKHQDYFIEDHITESYYPLLLKLPRELRERHVAVVEEHKMNASEATAYLEGVLEQRHEATTETFVSDARVVTILAEPSLHERVLTMLESTVFQSPTIGEGQTAKIKRFDLESVDGTESIPMAIKYLLTPTAKTLSASGEHDMLREVERMSTIEEIEHHEGIERIRVPHPYLHHKNELIQCYGMEFIDGADLRQVIEGEVDDELLDTLSPYFDKEKEQEIQAEFERFLTAMHTYCLHGDIKPANIMVNRDGRFYLIDFGQSILVNDIDDTGRSQLDNLRELELEQTKTTIRLFIKKIASHAAKQAITP
jgi:serine/threonine protein kinase